MLRHILPGDRCCPLLEHTTFISHNSLLRNLFIFLGEPVFIKYGSPSVSSTVTTHKQSDIKSRLREPEEVKCLTFCDLDNGSQRGAIKSRRFPQRYPAKPLSLLPPKVPKEIIKRKKKTTTKTPNHCACWRKMVRDLNAYWIQMLRSDSDGHRRVDSACSIIVTTRKGHASSDEEKKENTAAQQMRWEKVRLSYAYFRICANYKSCGWLLVGSVHCSCVLI